MSETNEMSWTIVDPHSDDYALMKFAKKMRFRLFEKRQQGRGGWDDQLACPISRLESLYLRAVQRGDLVNVANYAMMLTMRGQEKVAVEAVATLYSAQLGIKHEA